MRRYLLTLFIATITCVLSYAQDNKIKTDRPSETQIPEAVGKKMFQPEIGFRFEREEEEEHTLEHPQILFRFGLLPKLELRAEITPQTEKRPEEKMSGLKPVELGFKLGVLEEKGIIPQTALQAHVGMRDLSSDEFKTKYFYPRVRLLFQNKLTDKIELGYNVGAEWNGESTTADWVYTVSPQFSVGEKWEVFIEEYAYIRKATSPQHHLDGGLAYYVNNNVKWDLWGGLGLSHDAPKYFVSTGISFRFH